MSKGLFWSLRILTFLGLGGTLFLLAFVSPYQDEAMEKINIPMVAAFLVAVFVLVFSFFSWILLRVRGKVAGREERTGLKIGISLRQGILIALAALIILILQSFRVLTWWDGMLAMGAIMMLGLYFLARE